MRDPPGKYGPAASKAPYPIGASQLPGVQLLIQQWERLWVVHPHNQLQHSEARTLRDSGAGSDRACLSQSKPRK